MNSTDDAVATNRSMPPATVIPELAYPGVRAGAEWLCRAFGFVERLRIGDHRAQLVLGSGSVIVTEQQGARPPETSSSHAILVRVADVDSHYAQARRAGATILSAPVTHPYGERQYSAADPAGHRWTFSQTVVDVDPAEWGGELLP
jgi:uncharacterized glyoxalase superfamily protein PhnB